ncbi:MAG: hypothetical protein ACLR7D_01910 [Lachnospira eligens]
MRLLSILSFLRLTDLHSGKGVLICENKEDALAGVDELMLDKKFGTAGDTNCH